jgi:spore coat protein U-like protein
MKAFFTALPIFFLILLSVEAVAFHCTVSTTPVSFGSYDVFSSFPLDSTGTITIYCNNLEKKAMPVTVSISSGAAGSFNPRQMQREGGDRMNYYLFSDPSRTTIWGDGTGGTSIFRRIIDRESPVYATVYGRIPARQNLRAGAYRDSLVVTVMW